MRALGLCIGASTLSLVALVRGADGGVRREWARTEPHNGMPREALLGILGQLDLRGYERFCVTGRRFREGVNLTSIPEPQAVETALSHLYGDNGHHSAVVSAGGETFMVYALGADGRISSVSTGNKCASGTGEFFLQQIARLGLGLDEAVGLARNETPYRVSGRCSVFCKSDCTHATNKGVPKGRVVAGLCQMIAGKILEIMKQIPRENVMVIGGTSRNEAVMECLRREIPSLVVPEEAPFFEAMGAALWALGHETRPYPGHRGLFNERGGSFTFHPPITDAEGRVDFKSTRRGAAAEGDRCVLGLDVGSTTTKAVILRLCDDRVLASVYLRTQGDPVGASRRCYAGLAGQLGELAERIEIAGLGVTGSGRQIAGLHALTEGIVNEIAAHASAALFFDPEVDTIFEIGGQDAKYTCITGGVPSDYAMNEACSAGTGSFLEEAARESMGVAMEDISGIAQQGKNPPNFNDQCAAFISSDIKRATHEGMSREDIVAGLVYSICMNYHKRVKGARPVGRRVFMQGGVCCNRAVPMAMALLTGKRIVVPPDPQLTGAFGVALEIKRRLEAGLMEERTYSLGELAARRLEYAEPFVCRGGKEKCDRACEIARVKIEAKVYPFGGACNRWYNLRLRKDFDGEGLDRAFFYEKRVYERDGAVFGIPPPPGAATVGLSRSFFVNTYFPLYARFFRELGLKVLLPSAIEQAGVDRRGAAFCYPAEMAHGYLENLLGQNPDFIFLPHFMGNPQQGNTVRAIACPLSQAEPYYLASAFGDHPAYRRLKESGRVLSPVIDFSRGFEQAQEAFTRVAVLLGATKKKGVLAFRRAVEAQETFQAELKAAGIEALRDLETKTDGFGVVIFGRSYNAFVSDAHMGIPKKFASRGIPVIPVDILPLEGEPFDRTMYWSAGRTILRGASFVSRHPRLFGCYITNFSCGPDSFILGYFRDAMGRKPSLTLELDSHVADAGLDTRIEAFIDIVRSYRMLEDRKGPVRAPERRSRPSCRFDSRAQVLVDEAGRSYPLDHPRVHVVAPAMGRFITDLSAAALRGFGIRAEALPPADADTLELGKDFTLCKECLPLQLTVGSLVRYLRERHSDDEILAYVMPTASGPCRFGQYAPFMERLIQKMGVRNAALISLSGENGYRTSGGESLVSRIWTCMVLADILQDVYSVLLANAGNKAAALEIFEAQVKGLRETLEAGSSFNALLGVLGQTARRLARVPMARSIEETPTILLTGEIFVRHDGLSRQYIVERLAEKGFAARTSGGSEWIYYADWCYRRGLTSVRVHPKERLPLLIRHVLMKRKERRMRNAMAASGLLGGHAEDVDLTLACGRRFIDPRLTGEAILTVGAALSQVLDSCCGVIAIGPFGCMPNRISEAILSRQMRRDVKQALTKWSGNTIPLPGNIDALPFLAIESDGNPFPQIIDAKLETFLLQCARVHEAMMGLRRSAGEDGARTRPDETMVLINESPSIILPACR